MLNVSQQKFNDDVYQTYKFPFSCAGLKNTLISVFSKIIIGFNSSEKIRIRKRINQLGDLLKNTTTARPNY
jgi:hypothetical protein